MTAPTSGPAVSSGTPTARWLIPMFVLMVGSFMSLLDSSLVNVAIPSMQRDFGAAPDDIEWVSTSRGGILPVMTLTILYRIVPMEKIGGAMGSYGLGIVVAPRRPGSSCPE